MSICESLGISLASSSLALANAYFLISSGVISVSSSVSCNFSGFLINFTICTSSSLTVITPVSSKGTCMLLAYPEIKIQLRSVFQQGDGSVLLLASQSKHLSVLLSFHLQG